MKKIIFLLLVAASLAPPGMAPAQTPMSLGKDANLSLFSGYYAKRQNTNENGNWLGVYADIPVFHSKNEKWNTGIWSLYNVSVWTDNLGPYTSHSKEFALGANGGIYDEYFSYVHTFYGGLAVGYENVQEIGRVNKKKYSSKSRQADDLLTGSINLNLMKYSGFRPSLFPRTQLVFNGQISLNSKKTLSENELPFKSVKTWNKGFYEATLKQSVVDIPVAVLFLQPKVGAQYSHYLKGNPDEYAYSFEISIHKAYTDDFFSVSVMQKFSMNRDYLFIVININLLKL